MTQKSFPHRPKRATDLLGIIHTDVCGPLRHVSKQGASYFITFMDDYSRYGYVYLLKHKHEVFETFKVFINEVENQFGKTIKALRSDRGGEYISQDFKDYLKACGIIQQLTPLYTPQHNGSATRILNMVPTKKVDKTPYELWYGKVPNLSYLKVWGCEALVKRDMPDKLQQRSVKCIFIGYPKETMGYYFYFPPKNKIVVAKYAEFFEKNLITQEVILAIKLLSDFGFIKLADRLTKASQILYQGPTSGIRAFRGTLRKKNHKEPQTNTLLQIFTKCLNLPMMSFLNTSVMMRHQTMKMHQTLKEEYDIWAMEMEHYLEYIDNEVWKVIQNGNSKKRISTGKDGIVRVLSPVTAAEIQAVEKERKAKNILLMAIPKEHMEREERTHLSTSEVGKGKRRIDWVCDNDEWGLSIGEKHTPCLKKQKIMHLWLSAQAIMRYALTSNPTIYDSLVKQFWQTATTNTIADGTLEIHATIDTIGYTITEASIRDTLQLADATGITMLPNDEIFEGMGKWVSIICETFTFWKSFFTPNGDI
ncbi:retrotransposon protein, putative, ty1-copia subclass [Tanacetum coccineum]